MSKAEIKKDYVHFYKPASPVDYPKGYYFEIVTEDKIEAVIKLMESRDIVAADTETTGLNFVTSRIVGVGLACEADRAFYFPFRHKVGVDFNLDERWLKEIYERVLLKKKTLWYNFPFDGQMLENDGLSVENMDIYDVMNLVWLTDTNWKEINAKWAAKQFLGWDLESFEQLIAGVKDFSYLHPSESLQYAATDPLINLNLYQLLSPVIEKESGFIVKLDNKVVLPLIRAHQVEQDIDVLHLDQVEKDIDEELPGLGQKIYQLCGRHFDVNSPAQVARVLEDMGIDTGERTKKGLLRTGADFLDRIEHPVAEMILRYRQLIKWRSSFLEVLREAGRGRTGRRFKYFICAVPTGRFAAGKDKDSTDWFLPVNAQAILKPHTVTRFAHKTVNGSGILGWEFNEEMSDLEVEYPDPRLNIRKAIVAPPGWYFVSIDYSGQELRIPANMSKEPSWIRAFNEGVDLHSLVSQEVFGGVSRDLRRQAKAVNFGILYGATPFSHARKFDVTQEAAEVFFRSYKSKYRMLFAWIDHEQRQAARTGVCYTAFGRPRRLHYWYSSSNPKVKAFARRSTVNSEVQGSAADIFRISFVNMYHKFFKVNPDCCRFRLVVHDEIDFILREDRVDLLDEIVKVLTLRRRDWPVPMEVGVEVGRSWGDMVKFKRVAEGWRPESK